LEAALVIDMVLTLGIVCRKTIIKKLVLFFIQLLPEAKEETKEKYPKMCYLCNFNNVFSY
jgi:hypothetical protein